MCVFVKVEADAHLDRNLKRAASPGVEHEAAKRGLLMEVKLHNRRPVAVGQGRPLAFLSRDQEGLGRSLACTAETSSV